ncbi:MAG: hypothetical protein HFH58_16635 [Lachnospiraceae bacterium]|nr:hypothetical protein [Lachnospiraceae bacterium]
MFNELINCTELLEEKFAGWQITKGFNQYAQLAEFVASEYDDSLTRAELEEAHPWMGALTEAQQDGLLEQAKRIRKKAREKESAEIPPDRRLHLAQRLREELAWWVHIKQGIRIALDRRQYDTVGTLLDIQDDVYAQNLVDEFAKAEKKADEK